MADITKCPGDNCPVKERCYRFTAPSSIHQSYFAELPGKLDTGTTPPVWRCDMFWGKQQDAIMETLQTIFKGQ